MSEFRDKIDAYLKQSEWRVKENANASYSLPNLLFYAAGAAIADYTLNTLYKDHPIVDLHNSGKVHIHDLSGGIAPYCAGWSLKALLDKGFQITNQSYIASAPAKHFRSAVSHINNFLGTLSNEWMGAQAFSDVDVYLAPYIYNDYITLYNKLYSTIKNKKKAEELAKELIKEDVTQSLQELLFNLNFPSRWGGQPPFTNFTLALTVPEDLAGQPASVAGKVLTKEDGESITYGELTEYVNLFNEIFFSLYLEGDSRGTVFTFPVLTLNVTEDFFKLPKKLLNVIITCNRKYGATYFQNCINGQSNLKPITTGTVRSMCCRLSLDLDELKQHTGGLFGNGEMTGSIGVVTVNLPMAAYIAKKENKDFYDILSEWMDIAANSLYRKRAQVLRNFKHGLFPYSKEYLTTNFRTHFLTLGYIGMHECMLNLGIDGGIVSDEGHAKAIEVLDFMRKKVVEYQKKYNCLFNLEATPSEGASFRLARKAKEAYNDIITSGAGDAVYFTNSCHPPVDLQNDLVFVVKHQEDLQSRHTGGTVVHFYIDGQPNEDVLLNLIKTVCYSKIPYFTFSVVFSYCPVHGYIPGRHDYCPYPHTKEQLEKYGEVIEDVPVDLNTEGGEDYEESCTM